jgi:acyl carrier protein
MITKHEALKWIANLFEEDDDLIKPETKRDEIPAWDSLGMLTLMAGLNDTFEIVMSDQELQEFHTVEDILQVLKTRGKLDEN